MFDGKTGSAEKPCYNVRGRSQRWEPERPFTLLPNPVTHQAGQAFEQLLATLDARGPVVLPALLLCDFGHLAREVQQLEAAGAAGLHLDVMDGRFVPQLTYGLVVVSAVRRAAKGPIEVHLMVEQPETYVEDYAKAGADILTVHLEGLAAPRQTLETITALGCRAHLAIRPGTPIERLEPYLDACDGVLVMSVEPGFGGQAFNPVALEKLSRLAELRAQGGWGFRLAVDGGISDKTIGQVAAAGAELIVAGSAVICSRDYAQAIATLEQLARVAS